MNKSKLIYRFKVTLDTDFKGRESKRPYREIDVLENQSLSTFAFAIVKSFGFYFDHCYGFYDNFENPYESKEMYELFTDIPEDPNPGALGVTYVKVSKAFYHKGKKLRFLFDYGDNWFFTIELMDIKQFSGNEKYPKLIKSVGKAPEQYPPLEEDSEEEEEIKLLSVN